MVVGDIAIIASSSRSRSLRDLRQTLDLDPSLTVLISFQMLIALAYCAPRILLSYHGEISLGGRIQGPALAILLQIEK